MSRLKQKVAKLEDDFEFTAKFFKEGDQWRYILETNYLHNSLDQVNSDPEALFDEVNSTIKNVISTFNR